MADRSPRVVVYVLYGYNLILSVLLTVLQLLVVYMVGQKLFIADEYVDQHKGNKHHRLQKVHNSTPTPSAFDEINQQQQRRPQLSQVPSASQLRKRRNQSTAFCTNNSIIINRFELFNSTVILICTTVSWIVMAMSILSMIPSSQKRFILGCTPLMKCGGALYQLMKGLCYTLFIWRVHTVFAHTKHAYSPRLLFGLMMICIICNLVLIIMHILFNQGRRLCANGNNNNNNKSLLCHCGIRTAGGLNNAGLVVPLLIQDLFFSVLCLRLFTAPLRKILQKERRRSQSSMNHNNNNNTTNVGNHPKITLEEHKNDNDEDKPRQTLTVPPLISIEENKCNHISNKDQSRSELKSQSEMESDIRVKKVVTKYTVTTMTAISTSLLTAVITIGTNNSPDPAIVDMFTNSVCLLFMTNWLDDYFESVFWLPLQFTRTVCSICIDQ